MMMETSHTLSLPILINFISLIYSGINPCCCWTFLLFDSSYITSCFAIANRSSCLSSLPLIVSFCMVCLCRNVWHHPASPHKVLSTFSMSFHNSSPRWYRKMDGACMFTTSTVRDNESSTAFIWIVFLLFSVDGSLAKSISRYWCHLFPQRYFHCFIVDTHSLQSWNIDMYSTSHH